MYLTELSKKVEGEEIRDRQRVKIFGLINKLNIRKTQNGNMMATAVLEDGYGECEIVCFSNKLTEYESILSLGTAVVVDGGISLKDEGDFSVIVNSIELLQDNNRFAPKAEKEVPKPKHEVKKAVIGKIFAKVDSIEGTSFKRVKALAEIFTGNVPLVIYDSSTKKYEDFGFLINPTDFVVSKLYDILSEESVVIKFSSKN
jgi:DNA polymerase-3 subunit alpha